MNSSSMNSMQHLMLCRELKSITTTPASNNSRNHPRPIALALAGILFIAPTARAGLPPGVEVFNDMQEVSDADLGHMRGKFASNNQVLYFGVEMASQWQTPNGSLVTAGANLDIDFRNQNGNTPSVHYVPTVTITQQGQTIQSSQNGSANVVSGGGGLANVNGVSQSIQVAGKDNGIRNDISMQVDVTSTQGGGSIPGAIQGQAGTVSTTGGDGTVASVTLSNNSIGLNVTVPGQGQILQQIRNQGVFQAARIGGDANLIHNQITMHIGLSQAGLGVGSMAAFQSLKGLPQAGMF